MFDSKNVDERAFLNSLPEEMVELAQEAVALEDKIEAETDPEIKQKLQHELYLLHREIILSAKTDHSMDS